MAGNAASCEAFAFDSNRYGSGSEARAAWQHFIEAYFDVLSFGPDDGNAVDRDGHGGRHTLVPTQAESDFYARVRLWHPGPVIVSDTRLSAQRWVRDHEARARAQVDHLMLYMHVEGVSYVHNERGTFEVTPGDIVLLDLASRHEVQMSDAHCVFLTVPRLALKPREDVHGVPYFAHLPAASAVGRMLYEHVESLVRHLPDLSPEALSWLIPGSIALISGSVNAAHAAADAADPAAVSPIARRIQRYVEANLAAGSLTPVVVCERIGVSRSRLHRLFESSGGFTRYVQSRRLTRCLESMASNPQRNIADIAYEWGFGNQSAFSRAFKRQFGMSPRAIKRGTIDRKRSEPVAGAADVAPRSVLTEWLLSLNADAMALRRSGR